MVRSKGVQTNIVSINSYWRLNYSIKLTRDPLLHLCHLDFLNNTNPFVIFDIDRRHYDRSAKKKRRKVHTHVFK